MFRSLALFAFLSLAGFAQPPLPRNNWNFPMAVETASDIFVADVLTGTVGDGGAQVAVSTKVRVVRVLKGDLEPGREISVNWQYSPGDGELPESKVPAARVLWLARKTGDAYTALRSEPMPNGFGGMMTVAASGAVAKELQFPPEAPLRLRLAGELAAAIEDLARKESGDHTPFLRERTPLGSTPGWLRAQDRMQSLTAALTLLDSRSNLDIYRYFSKSDEASLALLGISGRFRAGDASAVFDLERDYVRLSEADQSNLLPRAMMGLNLPDNLEAAHVLGKLALAENAIPGVDTIFAYRIGQTHRREFLPYLVVMIGSPDPTARGAALYGLCDLLSFPPEAKAYCFNSIPVKDREQEKLAVRYWTEWWEKHSEEIGKTTRLPKVQAPARYGGLS